MKASTKRALSILFSVFFLILTVIVYTNFVLPQIDEVSKLRAEVASKNRNYETQKNAIAQVSEIVSQFKNAADLQKTLSFSMPIKLSVVDVLNQWYAISKNSNADIRAMDIKLSSSVTKTGNPVLKGRGSIAVSLSAVSTYDGIKQFLNSLETNARVVNIQSFTLTPMYSGVNMPGALFAIDISLETYYQAE